MEENNARLGTLWAETIVHVAYCFGRTDINLFMDLCGLYL